MSEKKIVVGAAMRSSEIPQFREWIMAENRDLEIQDPVLPQLLDGDWQSVASEKNSQLDGYTGRIGIHGPFLSLTIGGLDPKIRQVTQDRMKQGLEFVEAIGGTHMVIHSPFMYFGGAFRPFTEPDRVQMEIDLVHETLDPIVAIAAELNCTLVIENIFDKNTLMLHQLIRSFESPFVMQSLDTGHAYITHRFGDGPSPDLWVDAAGDMLGHIHIQDTDGLSDRHWAPGNGLINWYALFTAIRKLNQLPRLILELSDRNMIPAGVEFLETAGLIDG